MAFDIVGKADIDDRPDDRGQAAGVKAELDRADAGSQRAFYEKCRRPRRSATPLPWQQGPRRMGTDKNADVLWVGNSWGAQPRRASTPGRSKPRIVPFPDPSSMQPYHLAIDKNHNVWGNLWTNDQIIKYDPASGKWTMFELPVRGTEIRHIALDERSGRDAR